MEREKLREEAFEVAASEYRKERGLVMLTAHENHAHRTGFHQGYSAASAWVPVEERLPEKAGIYAVVIPTLPGCPPTVTYDAFHENGTWTHYQGHIAWMPIPPFGGTNEN